MRTLGLDIGTNSIGWCLIEDGRRLIDIGARIYSDGRDPKSGASLAEDRRLARGMRRRRDRYLGRREAFLKALKEHGLLPADTRAAQAMAAFDPYEIRARALGEKLSPHETGRALFHLNQRRGFKSNRKAERKSNDKEDGKIASGAKALDDAMRAQKAPTLGAFLYGQATKRVRAGGENQAYDFYPQRHHIETEFEAIWRAQAAHWPEIFTPAAHDALYRILFFQRPLKEQEVGFCTFAGMGEIPEDDRRLPKSDPLFQLRRLYEEVNHLKIVAPGAPARDLTMEQRDGLIAKLRDKKKVTFDSLARAIKLKDGERFNKESENRRDLAGDEIRAELGDKKRFGKRWANFPVETQRRIVEHLRDEENPEALLAWLRREFELDEATAAAVANAHLPEGYGRFGETATRLLLEELQGAVISYDKAVAALGFHHSDQRTGECFDFLPYYGEILSREISPGKKEYGDLLEARFGKISNPTVHIALRQLQKIVNAVIAVHGKPERIVVELARDLKMNDEDKAQYQKDLRRTTAEAQRRGDALVKELKIENTGANRMRLRLWEELNPDNALDRACPYCGGKIGVQSLFSEAVEIDHIIPYSRSLDDSPGNKIVAHRNCNREKGNRTPFEAWGWDADKWAIVAEGAARLRKSRQWRFGPEAMERYEGERDFLARQLVDTQHLSRAAGKYLRALYPTKDEGRVDVIPGRMTAMLRRLWGLNSLLPDHNFVENEHSGAPKNRLDHRHHAIDAAVVAATSLGLMQQVARAAARAEAKELDRLFEDLPQPWEHFREQLGERLKGVVVSHRPDHGRSKSPSKHRDVTSGRLHNETAYGFTGEFAADGKTPIVVHRIPLTGLKPADLEDESRIPDPALRAALLRATAGREGKDFEQALALFSKAGDPGLPNGGPFKGLRRLRVREPLTVIPIRDREGRAYKGYKGDSNACYNVWRMPDGSWKHDVVSTFDAHQKDHNDARPHPAAKKILCLRQNDLIAVERDGGKDIMRVVAFSQLGQAALVAHNEAGSLRDRNKSKADPLAVINPTVSGLKKMKARQVRIDPLGRVFDPGPRE